MAVSSKLSHSGRWNSVRHQVSSSGRTEDSRRPCLHGHRNYAVCIDLVRGAACRSPGPDLDLVSGRRAVAPKCPDGRSGASVCGAPPWFDDDDGVMVVAGESTVPAAGRVTDLRPAAAGDVADGGTRAVFSAMSRSNLASDSLLIYVRHRSVHIMYFVRRFFGPRWAPAVVNLARVSP